MGSKAAASSSRVPTRTSSPSPTASMPVCGASRWRILSSVMDVLRGSVACGAAVLVANASPAKRALLSMTVRLSAATFVLAGPALAAVADTQPDNVNILTWAVLCAGVAAASFGELVWELLHWRRLRRSETPSGKEPAIEGLAGSTTLSDTNRVAGAESTGAARQNPVPRPIPATDPEFLPAALEILVTPPSPAALWLMASISMAAVSGLAWSYFGWLDVHAVAPGKIQPNGRSKIVQPLEPGKIVAIRVDNGSKVEAGDVLLELDPTETTADHEAQVRDLESARAETARRKAALLAVDSGANRPGDIDFGKDVSVMSRRREAGILAAELAQLRSAIDGLKAQIAEKAATNARLKASIAARQRLIELSRERVAMREAVEATGAGSRALVIEALQQLETHITTDAGERGQLIETDAAIVSLERRIEQTIAQFVAEQMQKLVETERKRDRLEQDVIKARTRSERTVLKAPIAGTVQQLAVTTIGQVVTTGQSLMTIVPADGAIEVEALIANKDIGFVKPGQRAVVKIEAFPFTRFGVIDAEVIKVSRDAVDDRDGTMLSDASAAAKAQANPTNSSSRLQSLVFPATLRIKRRSIVVDGGEIPLSPGMTVTVEIKTGERRAIDYVLSPLREMVSQTAHER
ncbi:MAG: HlyD family type I secretion periplasmic adaptor subunit [Hyphomicrobiaceae bacterium]|nr:MAG: HlyD family type I secretion periplasmic adaptor subunit [Hyphomicrobiaceae bacterium]